MHINEINRVIGQRMQFPVKYINDVDRFLLISETRNVGNIVVQNEIWKVQRDVRSVERRRINEMTSELIHGG